MIVQQCKFAVSEHHKSKIYFSLPEFMINLTTNDVQATKNNQNQQIFRSEAFISVIQKLLRGETVEKENQRSQVRLFLPERFHE